MDSQEGGGRKPFDVAVPTPSKLTPKDTEVLAVLELSIDRSLEGARPGTGLTPSEIGKVVKKKLNPDLKSAPSAYVQDSLRKLIKMGCIKSTEKARYHFVKWPDLTETAAFKSRTTFDYDRLKGEWA